MLKWINRFRTQHGAQPLTYSDQISTHAQKWANRVANQKRLTAAPNSPYGQVLFEMHTNAQNGINGQLLEY